MSSLRVRAATAAFLAEQELQSQAEALALAQQQGCFAMYSERTRLHTLRHLHLDPRLSAGSEEAAEQQAAHAQAAAPAGSATGRQQSQLRSALSLTAARIQRETGLQAVSSSLLLQGLHTLEGQQLQERARRALLLTGLGSC
jgi:hypothetical protein